MAQGQSLLDKLNAQKADLDAQIKAAKKAQKAEQEQTKAQRAAIIGAAILDEMEANQTLAQQLNPIIEKRVKGVKARRLLGLPNSKA